MIAKYILKAHVHFFMHAGMQASKMKEKTVRSEHLKFSCCGKTVQNSLWILFFKCCVFLNEIKPKPNTLRNSFMDNYDTMLTQNCVYTDRHTNFEFC